jgi:hypothetical protein
MKYANHIGYSDVDPYEIVRIVSDKTIEIREMKTEPDTSVELKWVAGGFAGHCVNQNEQKWIISSDETAPVIRIRNRDDIIRLAREAGMPEWLQEDWFADPFDSFALRFAARFVLCERRCRSHGRVKRHTRKSSRTLHSTAKERMGWADGV